MENYVPSEEEEIINDEPPFPSPYYTQSTKIMNINKNTKFGNIIDFANKHFENESNRFVIFRGVGEAADKCISCVEVFKKKSKVPFHQWTKLGVARRVTYWDPLTEGMDRLKVSVDTPVMFILVSRDPFPVELQCLSMQSSKEKSGCFGNQTTQHHKRAKPALSTPGGGKNKWARPEKEDRPKESEERQRIREEVTREQTKGRGVKTEVID